MSSTQRPSKPSYNPNECAACGGPLSIHSDDHIVPLAALDERGNRAWMHWRCDWRKVDGKKNKDPVQPR